MRPTRLASLVLTALLVAGACAWGGEEAGRGREAAEGTSPVEGAPTLSADASPAAPAVATPSTPSATATATVVPARPYRVTFAAGETIDVSPAVVFADLETLEAEAWVIPDARFEFAVSPAGTYVIYNAGDGFKLLRTDDGSVTSLGIGEWPVELGPGDSGFIARGEEQFLGSLFDGKGKGLRSLWLSDPEKLFVAAWAPDGRSIAITQIDGDVPRVKLEIWPELMSPSSPVLFSRRASQETRPSLEWSPDSERLALVTSDAVRVFDRERTLLWTVEGEFFGNPRWSPDGAYLTVSAMPSVVGHDGSEVGIAPVTYLLTRDGAEVLRVTGAGSCAVDPWHNASAFTAGRNIITVDGVIRSYPRRIPEIWYGPETFGLELAPDLGFHLPHIAARSSGQLLEDGRLVFTTPEIGHGDCGTIVGASEWPAIAVERPPYGPVRSARAGVSDQFADQADVLRVIDAVLDASEGEQIASLLELAHRYEAVCSFHGELSQHCEDAGLGVYDTFPGVPLSILSCEACYVPVEEATRVLAPLTDGAALELEAIWEVGPLVYWPYSEFEDAEQRFAIWFVREDRQRLGQDDPLGVLVLVLVVPGVERPVVALERGTPSWTGHRTATRFGNWELLYLAGPAAFEG